MIHVQSKLMQRLRNLVIGTIILLICVVGVTIGVRYDLKNRTNTNETGTDEKSFFASVDKSQPGYWLTDEDKEVLNFADKTEIINNLDTPRGYHERDLSSKPNDMLPVEYYTPELNVLYLAYDGFPMWTSLVSQKEYLEGVDLVSDKDGDGLTDFEERHIYKTRASVKDTDGDGYADLDEIINGYDPKRSDALLNASRLE